LEKLNNGSYEQPRAKEFWEILKIGRPHLMEERRRCAPVPPQEFSGLRKQVALRKEQPRKRSRGFAASLPLGGTAVRQGSDTRYVSFFCAQGNIAAAVWSSVPASRVHEANKIMF